MSNHLAIATVTATLGDLVHKAAEKAISAPVLLQFGRPTPPASAAERKVHVYLYQITPNAALRNAELAWRDPAGRSVRRAQAALDLHYLLTFVGDAGALEPDRMAGAVARDLTARAILDPAGIGDAIAGRPELDGSDLAEATEHVKFVLEPLSLDELSKLWSVMIQTPHTLSVAYLGTVVLIDEELDVGRPAPVLRRGEPDRGADVRTGVPPRLDGWWAGAADAAARLPRPPSLPMASLGLRLVLQGENLGGDGATVRLSHRDLPIVHDLAPVEASGDRLSVDLPSDAAAAAAWAAGLYDVTVGRGTLPRSNRLPLPLAPEITAIAPNPAQRNADGAVTVTVSFRPELRREQRASLLLPAREVPAAPVGAAAASLDFAIEGAPALTAAPIRLRVGPVESMTFRYDPAMHGFVFDDAQRLTIT